jgi:predicted  nucleic acid-binding Zn-ribbon protein
VSGLAVVLLAAAAANARTAGEVAGGDGNTLALSLATLSLIGALAAAIAPALSKRVRGVSDARDDKVAENTTLRSAAEVAMQLVNTTRSWASDLLAAMQLQIESLKTRVAELEHELEAAQGTIDKLRETAALSAEEYAAELARLRERTQQLQVQKERAEAEVARLEAVVRENQQRIEQLTFSPEQVIEHRALQLQRESEES